MVVELVLISLSFLVGTGLALVWLTSDKWVWIDHTSNGCDY